MHLHKWVDSKCNDGDDDDGDGNDNNNNDDDDDDDDDEFGSVIYLFVVVLETLTHYSLVTFSH